MNTVTISATQARNNFFDIINAAIYNGQVTTVLKNGEEVVTVAPVKKKEKFDWDKYLESVRTLGSFLTDEDVEEYKKIRKELNKPRFPNW